jgi:hypothetical protein
MDYKYIEQLIERYWECQTSLEEEAILRAFFSQDNIPANLAAYKSLFVYANKQETETLDSDFDKRMEALVSEPQTVKARIIPFRQRLAPLFKAAAMVAIILTLGNASQMAFTQHDETAPMASSMQQKVQNGPSVAMGDSVKMDTLKKAEVVTTVIK